MARGDRSEKTNKKKWLKLVVVFMFLLIVAGGVAIAVLYNGAKQTVNKEMYSEVPSIDKKEVAEKIEKLEPLNILLLGVDARDGNSGRSDALMVLSLNPNENRMQLISIPRDSRTLIVGKGFEDKINHAYAFGGTDMSISTVEAFLDIDLDYYVEMNMEGLSEMVDAIGGITVTNKLDWYDEGYYQKGYHYSQGELNLTGPQAMGYVRMRYLDPDGDFGRTNRQRQVIEAIISKGSSIKSVNKIQSMVQVLGNNMATNMNFDEMKNLFLNYSSSREKMDNYMIKGSGTKIDGIYYLNVSKEEREKVNGMIKDINS